MRVLVAVLLLIPGLAACGDGKGGVRSPGATSPVQGPLVGQEIWLTYFSPAHATKGRRIHRSREEARRLAETLRARVLAGEDIGDLAAEFSNAPGAAAEGFSGVLPVDAAAPSARDRAIADAEVGELTPLVDWEGGWWFARRVDLEEGERLARRFHEAGRERRRFRAIVLLYRGAYLPDRNLAGRATRSLERARELGRTLLARARAGEDFATLASEYSDDPVSAAEGGLVTVPAGGGERTAWVHRFETWVPDTVLRAVFSGEPETLHDEVVESPRGVFVIRREDARFVDPQ